MGKEFQVNSLEDMCDLMCNNYLPEDCEEENMEADDWIHEASEKIQALEETIEDLREKLRKERKKKKRWKRKYLEMVVDYNELKMIHDDMCRSHNTQDYFHEPFRIGD